EAMPVFCVRVPVLGAPRRIRSDAGHTNEEVHVPHDLREYKRRDARQRQSSWRTPELEPLALFLDRKEAHPTGRYSQVDDVTGNVGLLFEVHIELGAQAVPGKLQLRGVVRIPLTHQIELPAALTA